VALSEALTGARFTLLSEELQRSGLAEDVRASALAQMDRRIRLGQYQSQLQALRREMEGLLQWRSAAEHGAAVEMRSHEQSVLAGAIGAAFWGAFRARKLSSRGLPLPSAG